jgi:DNA polymerase-1
VRHVSALFAAFSAGPGAPLAHVVCKLLAFGGASVARVGARVALVGSTGVYRFQAAAALLDAVLARVNARLLSRVALHRFDARVARADALVARIDAVSETRGDAHVCAYAATGLRPRTGAGIVWAMSAKRLVVIDGYSLLFRAFYGTRYLSTSAGRPTNALFGFVNMLFTLFNDIKPDAVVVALDAPGKTFRHAEFAEYKGTRRETPQELIEQLEGSRELISAFNIPVLELTGFEADDIVGTLSKAAEARGYHTTIVTGDLDSLQLVDDCVSVMTPQNFGAPPKVYTPAEVVERYGFGPEHVVDYKAMAGDTSDNIPGVKGVGDKTATDLIKRFGSVESIIESINEIEPKHRKKIEPEIDVMKLSKWLATIQCDAPVDFDFAPYRLDATHLEQIRSILTTLEFRAQVKRLDAVLGRYVEGDYEPTASIVTESVEVRLHDGVASYKTLVDFAQGKPFSVLATTGEAQPSMFEEQTEEAYVAVGKEVRRTSYEDARKLVFANPERAMGHDIKPFFKHEGAPLSRPRFDSMLAGYVLQSDRGNYDLGDLIQGHLDVPRPDRPEERAVAIGMIEKPMREKLRAEGQVKVLDEIELPLVPVLAEMERYGIQLDTDYLGEYSKMLESRIEGVRKHIYEVAGEEFNIGSPKQIGTVLFEKMKLPGGKKTKTGWGTGAEILEELAGEHEIASEILNYRELTKLKGTYADALPRLVAADGRVHTTYSQAVAATGRLSSNDPNLQNIPVRTELGRQIRKAFTSPKGNLLASFDYSQIELRVLAHMCKDEALVGAFQRHEDVHRATAALMFRVEGSEVTREQRNQAKLLNFAVLYGVTDFGLARQLGVGFSVADARELIEQYNTRFAAVKAFTDSIVEGARRTGFTTTLSGRRRYFPEIHAANRNTRMYSERQAMNAPLQGTAADMIKVAMVQVRKHLGSSGARMLLQVHDELVFEVSSTDKSFYEPVREVMQSSYPLDVPVVVDAKKGANWLEMDEVACRA